MTFVGKVLVVLQVIFTIVFMAFAGAVYTVHVNWKAKAENADKQIASMRTQLDNQAVEHGRQMDELNASLAATRNEVDQLTAANSALTLEKTNLAQQLQTVMTERDTEQDLARISAENARVRREEAVARRQQNDLLHKSQDQLVAELRKLQDENFNLKVNLDGLQEKHGRILENLAFLEKVVQANGFSTDPRDYQDKTSPPPVVRGLVLNTKQGERSGTDFVEVSLGSDDGLLEGHELYVYRDAEGKYLGKINIVYVTPDRAVGTVVQRAKNGTIQRGDNVSTKL